MLMGAETGVAGRPRCDTPWSAYLNLSFAAGPDDYGRVLLSNTLLGYHLPRGYCDLLFDLAGAYGSFDDDELAADRAALRGRLRKAGWERGAAGSESF